MDFDQELGQQAGAGAQVEDGAFGRLGGEQVGEVDDRVEWQRHDPVGFDVVGERAVDRREVDAPGGLEVGGEGLGGVALGAALLAGDGGSWYSRPRARGCAPDAHRLLVPAAPADRWLHLLDAAAGARIQQPGAIVRQKPGAHVHWRSANGDV